MLTSSPFTPAQVLAFYGNHRWMGSYSVDRAFSLKNATGWGEITQCRQLTSEWMESVRTHEAEAFDAVMRLHAPNGFTSLPDVFRDWDRERLGRILEATENRATLQRFGFRVRDLTWPWNWEKSFTKFELNPLLSDLLTTLKMQVHFWEAGQWSAARFLAMSVYPDRFPELAARSARRPEITYTSFAGLHFRPRSVVDKGNYSIWLVLEGGGTKAVIDLADDDSFPKHIRELVKESIGRLTATDLKYPMMLTLVDPSERQKQIVVEALAGISGDKRVRLRILTPVERRTSDERPMHVLEWNGRRYVASEETFENP